MERCKSKRIVKPIVYGNMASALPKKREEDNHTHEWTVFVRPYYAEDMSKYVRKVQFKLHESYANPTRVLERPPFEIRETGWGEFEVHIRIFFVDFNEKPVNAFHYLRLFHPTVTLSNGRTIVVSEYYDEIIFQEPTVNMAKALLSQEGRKFDQKRFYTDFTQVRNRTLDMINAAREQINKEIDDLKDSLRAAHELLEKYRKETANLERSSASVESSLSMSKNGKKLEAPRSAVRFE